MKTTKSKTQPAPADPVHFTQYHWCKNSYLRYMIEHMRKMNRDHGSIEGTLVITGVTYIVYLSDLPAVQAFIDAHPENEREPRHAHQLELLLAS